MLGVFTCSSGSLLSEVICLRFGFGTRRRRKIPPELVELKTATETDIEAPASSSGDFGALNKACVPFCPTETMVVDEAVA